MRTQKTSFIKRVTTLSLLGELIAISCLARDIPPAEYTGSMTATQTQWWGTAGEGTFKFENFKLVLQGEDFWNPGIYRYYIQYTEQAIWDYSGQYGPFKEIADKSMQPYAKLMIDTNFKVFDFYYYYPLIRTFPDTYYIPGLVEYDMIGGGLFARHYTDIQHLDLQGIVNLSGNNVSATNTHHTTGFLHSTEFKYTVSHHIPEIMWFNNPREIYNSNELGQPMVCADGSAATIIEFEPYLGDSNPAHYYFLPADEDGYLIPEDSRKQGYFDKGILQGNGMFLFRYHHPQELSAENDKDITNNVVFKLVNVNSSISLDYIEFKVYRCPVVMFHGVWGKPSLFLTMENKLKSQGWTEDLLLKGEYPNDQHFSQNIPTIDENINNHIWELRRNKISAGKVDVVCHSMGGLLTRLFMQDHNYRNQVKRLITCNTPHAGSQAANLLMSSTLLRIVLSIVGMNADNGAVEDLCVDSPAIKALNSSRIINNETRKRAIVSTTTAEMFAQRGEWKWAIAKYCAIVIGKVADVFLSNYIYNEDHDLIVPLSSQKGGIYTISAVFVGQEHMGSVENDAIIQDVINTLKAPYDASLLTLMDFNPPKLVPPIGMALNSKTQNKDETEIMKSLHLMDGSIKITSPSAGTIVDADTTITIGVTGSNQITTTCLAVTPDEGSFHAEDKLGYTTTFKYAIPTDAAGNVQIGVLGIGKDQYLAIDTIKIHVKIPTSLTAIQINPHSLVALESRPTYFSVYGNFADGSVRDLHLPNEFTYQIINTKYAHLANPGVLQGDLVGTSTLMVRYGSNITTASVTVLPKDAWDRVAGSVSSEDWNLYK